MELHLDQPRITKLLQERRVRMGINAAGVFSLCLLAIYLTKSDRVALEYKSHQKIEVSGKSEQPGGLSINGIVLPYTEAQNEPLYASLEDFVQGNAGSYNLQFNRSSEYPAESVVFHFQRGAGEYSETLDFATSIGSETKEVTFGGKELRLQDIEIRHPDGKKYIIKFQEHKSKDHE